MKRLFVVDKAAGKAYDGIWASHNTSCLRASHNLHAFFFCSRLICLFIGRVSPFTVSLQSQKELFWFGSPGMMLVALQTIQFLLAIMVGALIW